MTESADSLAAKSDAIRSRMFIAWGLGIVGVFALGSIPVDAKTHLVVSWVVVGFLWVSRWLEWKGIARFLVVYAALYIGARYLFWRTTSTLDYTDPYSYGSTLLLYAAEIYGISILFLAAFINGLPNRRRPLEALPLEECPTVDVLIPTINEPVEVIETTLLAAVQIDYPEDRIRIHLLDDGATDERINSPDPKVAGVALERHETLRLICQRLGVEYRARANNDDAKAGNLNAAFAVTDGELVLVLDCDHVPAREILQDTVGYFARDPKLFAVQTPHFFTNQGPVERNLQAGDDMPAESEMFFSAIQPGMDFWGSALYCGSAAVLRRACLAEVGGFVGETVLEWAETSLLLHARGYRSVYVNKPLVAGLLPETLRGFMRQRVRWAQGMVQLFLLRNPLIIRGLKPWQRLCYFNNGYRWFFPYARLMFLFAPLVFLLMGWKVYEADGTEILAYTVPQVLVAILFVDFLFGRTRRSFMSALYETLQSLYTLPAILSVFFRPHSPKHHVTPKGEKGDAQFISPLGFPFYFLAILTAGGLAVGLWQLLNVPNCSPLVILATGWAGANMFILLAAVGIAFERRERRSFPRIPVWWSAEIEVGEIIAEARVHDVSSAGVRLEIPEAARDEVSTGDFLEIRIKRNEEEDWTRLHGRLRTTDEYHENGFLLGVSFEHLTIDEAAAKIALIYGAGSLWQEIQRRRGARYGLISSLFFLCRNGIVRAVQHLAFVARSGWRFLVGSERLAPAARFDRALMKLAEQ